MPLRFNYDYELQRIIMLEAALGEGPWTWGDDRKDIKPFLRLYYSIEAMWAPPEMDDMARKMRFHDIEFVSYRLSPEHAEEVSTFAKSFKGGISQAMALIAESGYKLSVSPDFDNECIIVTLTGTRYATANVGRAMSSRADNSEDAFWIAIYKHLRVFDGETWDGTTVGGNWG